MKTWKECALEWLYPLRAVCMGCGDVRGTNRNFICDACRAKLQPLYPLTVCHCARCGSMLRDGKCSMCRSWGPSLLMARAVYAYQEPINHIIWKFKYESVYRMDRWLGQEMLDMMAATRMPRTDYITPVPMHWLRQWKRGYNQSAKLARVLAEGTKITYREVVRRIRYTPKQANRSRADRLKNVVGAFGVRGDVRGKTILLVDDVRTTGATATACADVLVRAGAKAVYLVTLAATGFSFSEK